MNEKNRITGIIDSDRIGYCFFACETVYHYEAARKLIESNCGVTNVVINRVKSTKPGFYGDGFPVITFYYTGTPK